MTIDQSAKWIGEARMGGWAAGPQRFEESDAWMIVGSNPLVSMVAGAGANQFAFSDPVKTVKRMRERGMKLIVVDPRVSETARFADLHLQPRPGRDGELAAVLLHVILREGWHDAEFCRDYVDGLDALQKAVAPFAPEACADMIGVTAEEIKAAAAMFARDARSGMTGTGTGPDMARHSNVAEHLFQAINIVCGRFPRSGDPVANPGVLQPEFVPSADVVPPNREWEEGPRTCARGLGRIRGTMMSAEIADEILHSSEGRMRALICVGGNLALALPDQKKAEKALAALDLLIVIDPRMSATARFADYVIAPKLQYERPDHTGFLERMFQKPFAHWTQAVVPPPAGSDVVDEAQALWALAKAAGLTLNFAGAALSTDTPPDPEELLLRMAGASRVPAERARTAEGGVLLPGEPVTVAPRRTDHRFDLLPADVAGEVAALTRDIAVPASGGFRLIVRRHREMMNSTGTDYAATRARIDGSPAYLHPDDLEVLGLAPGDPVEIVRGKTRIAARLAADAGLRRGVIAMGHCWPGTFAQPWEATNALVDGEADVQPINRMPVMTGIAVTIEPLEAGKLDRWASTETALS
jgi:anaerobic selenocysteine-containing dehydrogenase